MSKKIALGLLGVCIVLVLTPLIGARVTGVWGLVFPSHRHETTPPDVPPDLAEPAVLVFSKTNAFRHSDGIAGGISLFEALGEKRGWGVFHTENGAVFNADDLAVFSVVVFNNVTGDVLSEAQERAFQQWLEAGGGWLGIHSAGDDSHAGWPWYVQNLIGATFTAHTLGPRFQRATLHVEDTSHVATRTLPASWQHREEWYSWEESVRGKGFNVLVTVDETTYRPRFSLPGIDRDLGMGDHPVVWNRCVASGRALYSALGHSGEAFRSTAHRRLLEGALDWLFDPAPCR